MMDKLLQFTEDLHGYTYKNINVLEIVKKVILDNYIRHIIFYLYNYCVENTLLYSG